MSHQIHELPHRMHSAELSLTSCCFCSRSPQSAAAAVAADASITRSCLQREGTVDTAEAIEQAMRKLLEQVLQGRPAAASVGCVASPQGDT